MPSQFDPKKHSAPAMALPVILLLDVSHSMSGNKIDSLNKAVEDMLKTLKREEEKDMETEYHVSVVTFESSAKLHLTYTKASLIQWQTLQADGCTNLGEALTMAKEMIEGNKRPPLTYYYNPVAVLVSDGQPTDERGRPTDAWKKPLEDFITRGRSAQCDRLALAIGADADEGILNRFLAGTPYRLFKAEEAGQIPEFFKWATRKVTEIFQARSRNQNPAPPEIKPDAGRAKAAPSVKSQEQTDEDDDKESRWR